MILVTSLWIQPKCDTIHLTEKSSIVCLITEKILWNTNIEIYGTIYMIFHHPFGKYFNFYFFVFFKTTSAISVSF